MTKHKIDDLFNQKLTDSEFSPSPAAWSRLEGQLAQNKKKGIVFWMSAAASIALLLTFGWMMFHSNSDIVPVKSIAQNNIEHPIEIVPIDTVRTQKETQVQESIVEEGNTAKDTQEENDLEQNATDQPIKKQKTPKPSEPLIIIQQKSNLAIIDIPEKSEEVTSIEKEEEVMNIDVLELNVNEIIASNIPVQQSTVPSKESGSIKLVYTLKPAISPESIAKETAEKTKSSPFKKMFAFAKNIKENPQGISNLRAAKNNFLSLNKKKNDSK